MSAQNNQPSTHTKSRRRPQDPPMPMGQPWRTEPEIPSERQQFLAARRAVKPDIEKGIYPFRDENGSIKLTRADFEWLLATLESGGMRGPVDWKDETQRNREGLDLRGADLHGARLTVLPLACLIGGSPLSKYMREEQYEAAAVHLEHAGLRGRI
jgi:hypothetical protein